MIASRGLAVAALVVLTLLGMAGNFFRYPVFFSIDFIFGSIFSMLALQLLGSRAGILCALATSSSTWLLWNHPYAIVILTVETMAVAWLYDRKKMDLVLADAVYWCVIGMPLVFLFYYGVMGLEPGTVTITMLKQALNGVTNTLIARILYVVLGSRLRDIEYSMRELMFNLLFAFVLFPALFLMATQSRQQRAEEDARLRHGLLLVANRTNASLQNWLRGHVDLIAYMAELAKSSSRPVAQSALEHLRRADADFLRVGLLDERAITVAYSPLQDDLGRSTLGLDFSDRPFIPQLKATLSPMLGEVVMARIGVPQPMVPVLAPVVGKNGYAGYVSGILNLARLKDELAVMARSASVLKLNYALLDGNGRVIVSNKGPKAMETYRRDKGEVIVLPDGLRQWMPPMRRNISVSERWKDTVYISETAVGMGSEWKLLLEAPVEPHQAKMYSEYTALLARLAVIIAIAILLAGMLSRALMASIEKLRAITLDLPARLAAKKEIPWERSMIRETQLLLDNFRQMAQSLSARFAEVRELNASLEARVAKRTRELQESEERFRGLANAVPVLVWMSDRTKLCTWFNQRWLDYTGRAMEQELGNGWAQGVHPEDVERCLRTYNEAFDARRSFSMEYRLRRHDGEYRWLVDNGEAVFDADGEFAGYIGSCMDITERKQAEVALAASKDVLEQRVAERTATLERAAEALSRSNMELQRFAYVASHDLQTPLRSIAGFSQLLERSLKDDSDANRRDWARRIVQASRYMHRMINELLEYARVDSRARPFEPVELEEVCRRALDMLAPAIESSGAQISVGPLPRVSGDRMQLIQLLQNLIDNAIKYCGGARPEIEVSGEQGPQGAVISVRDNGPGIAPDQAERIFEIFYRGNSESPGTGIGLAVCRRIVHHHGGRIWVEPSPGKGSTFRFTLPGAAA